MADKVIKKAMKHKNVLGAGAKLRSKVKDPNKKIVIVMKEFKLGTLHSGSGAKVIKRPQAMAIAWKNLSEARKTKKKGKKQYA